MEQYYDGNGFSDIEKAIEINPKHAGAYVIRGVIQYKWRQYDRAIADFDKVVELYPKEGAYYQIRGDAHQSLGNTSRAEADFKKAQSLGVKPFPPALIAFIQLILEDKLY